MPFTADDPWVEEYDPTVSGSRFIHSGRIHHDDTPGFSHLRGGQAHTARVVVHRFHHAVDEGLETGRIGFDQVCTGFEKWIGNLENF